MKIHLIITGGTIGSAISERRISLSEKKTTTIIEYQLRKLLSDNDILELSHPYIESSENLTVDHWNILVNHIDKIEDCDAVVLTHGTDSLAYTSAILSQIFAGKDFPIIIVSASYVLTDLRSNGIDNLKGALKIIENNLRPGVYVPYKNIDGNTYIHLGQNIKQARGFIADFYSDSPYAKIGLDGEFKKLSCESQNELLLRETRNIKLTDDFKFKADVFAISPYIGIDYSKYSLEYSKAVLHELYHSGTASVEISVLKRQCDEFGIPLFVAPVRKNKIIYDSIGHFLNIGIIPIYDVTWETAYAKLMVGRGLGYSGKDLESFIEVKL